MILVDTNILMYAHGADHAFKGPSAALVERIAGEEADAAIDAETLQELLHRYRSIGRWHDGKNLYDLTRRIFATIIPITTDHADHARDLMDAHLDLRARDAIHAAVCLDHCDGTIVSYDRDFDQIRGIRRLTPDQV